MQVNAIDRNNWECTWYHIDFSHRRVTCSQCNREYWESVANPDSCPWCRRTEFGRSVSDE